MRISDWSSDVCSSDFMSENLSAKHQSDGEIHPGETVEEKISLSERFGLWLSFYPFKQDDYLDIVYYWLGVHGCSPADIAASRTEALQWALERGRSEEHTSELQSLMRISYDVFCLKK